MFGAIALPGESNSPGCLPPGLNRAAATRFFSCLFGTTGITIAPLATPKLRTQMNRHHPGKINPVLIAFLIPVVVILTAAVFMVVRNHLHESLEPFDVAAYQRSPNELQGNHYNLDAQIESQLRWDEGFGRLLKVKTVSTSEHLSLLVPDKVGGEFNSGQRFHFKVMVKDGLIQVEELEKY